MKPVVKLIRVDNFHYSFKLSSKDGIRHVATALTFENPDEYATSQVKKFDKSKMNFFIGMIPILERYLRTHNVSYELTDYEFSFPEGVAIDDRMSGKYIHQKKAVEAFFKKRFGIIKVPTRGGKTFIASEIFRIVLDTEESGNIIFYTDSTTLFDQAVKDFKSYFEPYGGIEIGEIRNGKIDTTKRLTVAMIQTVQSTLSKRCNDRKKKRELTKFLREMLFVCVDEIHDNYSNAKYAIYAKSKDMEYLLCLSATPYRSGAFLQNLKLQAWSGDVIYDISEKDLRSRNVLTDYKVFMLFMDHNDIEYDEGINENNDYLGFMRDLIYNNELRNNIICRILSMLDRLKLKTLVIFQSVDHGLKLSELTGIQFISGASKGHERELAKNNFLEGEGGTLLASGIFKKGVTLPEVEVLINVNGGLEDANTIQKKGRVLGHTDSKSRSLIIDFMDVYDAYLSVHSETRFNTYIEAIGEKNVGVLDVSVDDCFDTLEIWIKKWFSKDRTFNE